MKPGRIAQIVVSRLAAFAAVIRAGARSSCRCRPAIIHMTRLLGLVGSIVVVLAGALYPFRLSTPAERVGPFVALIASFSRSPPIDDFLVNILFYAPVGFFCALARRTVPGTHLVIMVVLVAGALSTATELMQYYIGRETSAFDIVANVLGASFGLALALLCFPRHGRRSRDRS
jgi:VanZ family protein